MWTAHRLSSPREQRIGVRAALLPATAGLMGLCDAAFSHHSAEWRGTQSFVGGGGSLLFATAVLLSMRGRPRFSLFLVAAAALFAAGTMSFWR